MADDPSISSVLFDYYSMKLKEEMEKPSFLSLFVGDGPDFLIQTKPKTEETKSNEPFIVTSLF